VQIIPSIEKKLKSFIQRIEPAIQINLWYLFAYSYFKVKNYKKALAYIHILQNEYKETDREDIYNLSKVFLLILFYELKKTDLLDYTLPKVTKQLEKKGKLFKTEMLVLEVLQKTIMARDAEKRKFFAELQTKLADIHSSKFEAPALQLFNFEEWCADKLKG
jgi:hypothetical protein